MTGMATLFVSDLHLDPARPAVTALFLDFLERRARRAEALYILGDLFEAWIGDDDDAEPGRTIAAALRKLTDQEVPTYFLHGNRDFLLGERFAAATGIQLLPENVVINLAGERVLLLEDPNAPETERLVTYDYTAASSFQRFRWAVETFFAPPGRVLRVLARPRFENADFVEIVLNEAPLKRALNDFAQRFARISMLILIAAGTEVPVKTE